MRPKLILLLCVLATACSDASGPTGDTQPPAVVRAAWAADTLWIANTTRDADLLIEVSDSSGVAAVTAFLTVAGASAQRDCTTADSSWRCRVAITTAHAESLITLDSVRAVDLAGNARIVTTSTSLRVIAHPRLSECRANIVDLAPGEIHYFAEAMGCFTMARGGEYVAAVFDSRAVDAAAWTGGPFPPTTGSGVIAGIASPFHGLGNTEPGAALAQAKPTSDINQFRDEEFCRDSPELIICRETPFAIGEDIDIEVGPTLTYRARVISKHSFITYAVELDDLAQWTPEWRAALDAATEKHLRVTIPLLQETLHPDDAATTRSGELLILMRRGQGPSHVNRWTRFGWSRALPVILMHIPAPTNTLLISILGHELAHVWQGLHRAETNVFTTRVWGTEGGATFLETEAARRLGGFSLEGNYTSDELYATEAGRDYLNLFGGEGRLERGYFDAAAYMRGLWHQCMRAGQGEDVCRNEITRGTLENWHNLDGFGLTARMRKLLGASWDPVRSVLEWSLATAADDRSPHPALQIPSVREAARETLFESGGLRTVGDTVGVSTNLPYGAAAHFRLFVSAGELIDLLPRLANVQWALARLH